jgi:rare lipoprotein A (peptidoglycan hydrolase)
VLRSRRRHAHAVSALLAAALAIPTAALASPGGGAGLPGGSPIASTSTTTTTTGSPTSTTPSVGSGNVTVSTSGSGITLQTTASGILGKQLTFSGTASSDLAGDTIQIQRSGHQTNWTWANTVSATVASDGTFSATWQANHIGRFEMRAIVTSTSQAQTASATPALTTTVYRPSRATEYGPGFYGKKTACGQRLRRGTIGLANRTLRCGESVAIYYQGRTLVVPVIDRGPYANGADWDLTSATARKLGMTGTATIDAVSLPKSS